MNQKQSDSMALPFTPEQSNDGEANGSGRSKGSQRRKEHSSSEATSATKSSTRPSSDRRPRPRQQQKQQEYAYKLERRQAREKEEEEEAIRRRRRYFVRQEEEEDGKRRAGREASQALRPPDDRYYAARRDPRQSRRYLEEQSAFYYHEEPRRQSSIARRGYTDVERRPHARRATDVPVGPRSRTSTRSMNLHPAGPPGRSDRHNSYYFDDDYDYDDFDDFDSYTSFDNSYYYCEEDLPPLEERVYVDAAGRPYRVVAPVEPRRRLYRPGRDHLTTPIPPPTRSLPFGYHRPSGSNRMSHRDYFYPIDRYPQQQPRASRRPPPQVEYDEFRRGSRYAHPSRRIVEEQERRRERPSSRISGTSKGIATTTDRTTRTSVDGRESIARRSKDDKPKSVVVVERRVGGDGELGDEDDNSEDQDVLLPRDQRGRLQRRHSIGSTNSREHILQDMHAVQLEDQRKHRHNTPPRRTVQGRLESSAHFVEWTVPQPLARRQQKPPARQSDFSRDSYGRREPPKHRPLRRSISSRSLDTRSYNDEEEDEHSVSMRPVRDDRPYHHHDGYTEEEYSSRRRPRFQRRHSFGSMSEHTLERSYMEDSYPSVF